MSNRITKGQGLFGRIFVNVFTALTGTFGTMSATSGLTLGTSTAVSKLTNISVYCAAFTFSAVSANVTVEQTGFVLTGIGTTDLLFPNVVTAFISSVGPSGLSVVNLRGEAANTIAITLANTSAAVASGTVRTVRIIGITP